MPPWPYCFEGVKELAPMIARALDEGEWRLVPTGVNRMPAAASYLRPPGDSEVRAFKFDGLRIEEGRDAERSPRLAGAFVFRAFKFDVLRIEDGRIAEITTFGPELFPGCGLATTL